MARIQFMNTTIDNLTMTEALNEIERLIEEDRKAFVVTPNVDHIVKLETDEALRTIYRHADLILTDGKPLLWISRLYKTPIKEKISGSDLFPLLCKLSAEKGYTMFFLGAAEGVAAKAAQKLAEKYPGLKVTGTYSPPFGFENNENEMMKIQRMIRGCKPNILIVGLGCPKQEKYIFQNRENLNVPISLGLGASLDFEAENVKRAPAWVSHCGLEWLYRTIQDPKRLLKRYVTDAVQIVRLIFKYRPRQKNL